MKLMYLALFLLPIFNPDVAYTLATDLTNGEFLTPDASTIVTVSEGTGTAITAGKSIPIGPNSRVSPGARISCDPKTKLILSFGGKWTETVLPDQQNYIVPYVPTDWQKPDDVPVSGRNFAATSATAARSATANKSATAPPANLTDNSCGQIMGGEAKMLVGGASITLKPYQRIFPGWRLTCSSTTPLLISYRNGTADKINTEDGPFTVPEINPGSPRRLPGFEIGGRHALNGDDSSSLLRKLDARLHIDKNELNERIARVLTGAATAIPTFTGSATKHHYPDYPVGIVLEGHGTMQYGSTYRSIGPLAVIFAESRLQSSADEKVVLKYLNGEEATIPPGETKSVMGRGLTSTRQLDSMLPSRVNRPVNGETIISPVTDSAIALSHLSFRWKPFPTGTKLTLNLWRMPVTLGDRPFWTKHIVEDGSGTEKFDDLTNIITGLSPERSNVLLLFSLITEQETGDSVTFALLSKPTEDAIKSELDKCEQYGPPLKQISRASVFQYYGLYTEAAQELDELLRAYPDSVALRVATINAYRRSGNVAREQALLKDLSPGTRLP